MHPSGLGTVGILGCGWLGKALAVKLLEKGFNVKGTTTTEDKLKELETTGIRAYQIAFLEDKITGALEDFLENTKVLIISIPPKYKDGDTVYQALKHILTQQNPKHLQKIIYISSTGVFKNGEHREYDEDSQPNAETDKGKYLIRLEQLFNPENLKQEVTVLRLGGLIKHGGRHPVHYLAGRTGIANPEASVNLIEQQDAVDLICALINKKRLKPVYHGVYPRHPARKAYYTQKATELGLEPPGFKQGEKSLGKTIRSEQTSTDLNFKFNSKI